MVAFAKSLAGFLGKTGCDGCLCGIFFWLNSCWMDIVDMWAVGAEQWVWWGIRDVFAAESSCDCA